MSTRYSRMRQYRDDVRGIRDFYAVPNLSLDQRREHDLREEIERNGGDPRTGAEIDRDYAHDDAIDLES